MKISKLKKDEKFRFKDDERVFVFMRTDDEADIAYAFIRGGPADGRNVCLPASENVIRSKD